MSKLATLFLREPGKSALVSCKTLGNQKNLKPLEPGEELSFKTRGQEFVLTFEKESVGQITDENILKKINYALSRNATIKFFVVRANRNSLDVLVSSNRAIFLSRNPLEVRPYAKHEETLGETNQAGEEGKTDDDEPNEETPFEVRY